YKPLVVAGDGLEFECGLKQCVQKVEPRLIGGKPGAHLLHAAKRADGDVSICIPAPGAAPVLQPQQLFWRLFYENFDGILVAEPVAARDSVVSVVIQCVSRFDYRGSATLGRNGVATHRVNLGDDRYAETGASLGHSNGSSKAGPTAADQKNVVMGDVHKPRDSLLR